VKILPIAGILIALGVAGCAKPQTVRREPPPRVTVAREAAPEARVEVPLPESPVEAVESEKEGPSDFRKASRRYTLVLNGTEARELFLSLAKENDLNIVLSPEVTGTVTLDIKEATAPEIIEEACLILGCRAEFSGKTVRILPEKRVTRLFRLDYVLTSRVGTGMISASTSTGSSSGGSSGGSSSSGGSGGGGGESQSTNSIQTEEKVDFWGGLSEELTTLLSGGDAKVVVNRAAGTVMVSDFPANIERIGSYLNVLESRSRTGVMIEAKILEVTLDDKTQYGIDWSAAPGLDRVNLAGSLGGGNVFSQSLSTLASGTQPTFQFGIAGSRFTAMLNAMASSGQLNVLSTPKISTLNNQKAIIRIGRQDVFFRATVTPATTTSAAVITYNPDTITEGIILSVTPQIGRGGNVMLSIHPSITAKVGEAKAPDGNTAPVVDVRETNTLVNVADGQSVFIGGLMQETTQEVVTSVPLLGDIPWMGALFRNTSHSKKKTELVILITPHVVPPADMAATGRKELESIRHHDRGYHVGGKPWIYGTGGELLGISPWEE
jgi:MSHA type pilus biogenesis protein MshL